MKGCDFCNHPWGIIKTCKLIENGGGMEIIPIEGEEYKRKINWKEHKRGDS